jgi:hypothetical protein
MEKRSKERTFKLKEKKLSTKKNYTYLIFKSKNA